MTRRAFSAKQCSESNSAAAGILRSSVAAHFLSNSGEEACFGCSGARSSESDRGIVFLPHRLLGQGSAQVGVRSRPSGEPERQIATAKGASMMVELVAATAGQESRLSQISPPSTST